jgi:hypothetical protein
MGRGGVMAWALLGLWLPAGATAEPPQTMQSAAEAARNVPAGAWQGIWALRRADPQLKTLASQRALTLTVFHDQGGDTATVDWLADRALCEPPTGEPCEWLGAQGQATAVAVSAQGLYAVLRLSADERDPFLLHLAPASETREATALLLSASGELRWWLSARHED